MNCCGRRLPVVEQTVIAKFADETALDEQVEKMLNEDGLAKADFIIVKHIDYQIDAGGYADGESN